MTWVRPEVDERLVRDAARWPDCDECQRGLARDDRMLPMHTASEACESGKRAHCTCDTCY